MNSTKELQGVSGRAAPALSSGISHSTHKHPTKEGWIPGRRVSSPVICQGFGITASSTWIPHHRTLRLFRLEKLSKGHGVPPSTGLLNPCRDGEPSTALGSPFHAEIPHNTPCSLVHSFYSLSGSVRAEIAPARTGLKHKKLCICPN